MLCITQDTESISEKEETQAEENTNDNDVPPNIPPLPQSHLQRTQQSLEKSSSVAKIISQFQEAAANVSNNVIILTVILANQ